MALKEFDRLRFEYEYGGVSLEELCEKHKYLITELQEYADLDGWTIQNDPNIEESEEMANYYSGVRKTLTIESAKRALVMWRKLAHLEDRIYEETLEAIENFDSELVLQSPGLELQRLTKILQTLQSNQLYDEAILTPAIKDKLDSDESPDDQPRRWDIRFIEPGDPKEVIPVHDNEKEV